VGSVEGCQDILCLLAEFKVSILSGCVHCSICHRGIAHLDKEILFCNSSAGLKKEPTGQKKEGLTHTH